MTGLARISPAVFAIGVPISFVVVRVVSSGSTIAHLPGVLRHNATRIPPIELGSSEVVAYFENT
jgi:hypothetical protein